jgi:hypothetical protein
MAGRRRPADGFDGQVQAWMQSVGFKPRTGGPDPLLSAIICSSGPSLKASTGS